MADTDSDGDTVPDCNDLCPDYDDRIDEDGNRIPDNCDLGSLITLVTDANSDDAILNGVTTQREDDLSRVVVPFGEDVFVFTDRNHQYNGARFTVDGVLTTSVLPDDIVIGLPDYLVGAEYVSTRNNNRDNSSFQIDVTVGVDVTACLLLDNRIGDMVRTDPPALGSGGTGVMSWVIDDGWRLMNTGISPQGQPDFGAVDEGGSISDFTLRSAPNSNLGVGPGDLVNNFWVVYAKNFSAGDTITLKEQNFTNVNMYGLVVVRQFVLPQ